VSVLRANPALLVIAGGVAVAMHVGKLPAALPVLRAELHLSLVDAGFLLSLVQFAGMLLGIAVGVAADTAGLKRTMLTGLAVLAGASALGATVHEAWLMMLLRALEGFGFLLASMPAPSLIRRSVDASRVNAALGWWGAYMPLGTALALVASPLAIDLLGWRGWWVLLGAVVALAAVLLAWMLPADAQARPGTGTLWRERLRRTLRAPGPWLVAITFCVYSAQWLSVIGFLPSVYAQLGVSAGWAGAATALAALVNMAGNIAAGRLLQQGLPAPRLLTVGFSAMALGGIAAFAGEGMVSYGGALVFSAVGGLVPGTLFSLAVRAAPGEDTISTTVGWMQQWSAFGQFAGPPLVAWVATRVGGWHWSGGVTAAFALTGLLLAARIAGRLAHPAR
jgi:CP family cyanate transporter-like MFS transporter